MPAPHPADPSTTPRRGAWSSTLGADCRSSRRPAWARQCSRRVLGVTLPRASIDPRGSLQVAAAVQKPRGGVWPRPPGVHSADACRERWMEGPPGAGAWAPTRAKAGGSQGGLAPLPIRGRGARRGTPTWGVPPKGALRGGPGGYPPWARSGGPPRGTPRDPPRDEILHISLGI